MRIFQAWLMLFGLVVCGIGMAHLFFGQSTYIGGGTVNATMDSDLRFFNLLFIAYGAAFMWAAFDLPQRGTAVELLSVLFFVGGLARLLAWAVSGRPSWFYIVMIPVELVIPVVLFAVLRGVRRGRMPTPTSMPLSPQP